MEKSPRPRPLCAGLTYVESLVCIAVSAILASLAVAPLREAIVRQRVASVRAELAASIQWARWEALRRNTPVTLVRRTDCGAFLPHADHWSCGWDMVAGGGTTENTARNNAAVLQTFAVPQDLRLVHPGGGALMQFARNGYPQRVGHRFVIGRPGTDRDAIEAHLAATLCMNRTGRLRGLQEQTTC